MDINKRINYLSGAFLLLFVWNLINGASLILIYFSNLGVLKLKHLIALLLFVLLPVTAYLIWKRQRMGWVLGTGIAAFSLFGELLKTSAIIWFQLSYSRDESLVETMSSSSSSLLILLYFSAVVWTLNMADIRSEFQIENKTRIFTWLVAVIICIYILSDIFNFISISNQ